jgi:hypothetical protein
VEEAGSGRGREPRTIHQALRARRSRGVLRPPRRPKNPPSHPKSVSPKWGPERSSRCPVPPSRGGGAGAKEQSLGHPWSRWPDGPEGPRGPFTCRQQLHGVSERRVQRVLLGHEFGQVLVLRFHLDRGCGRRGQQRGRRWTAHCRVGTRGRGRQ